MKAFFGHIYRNKLVFILLFLTALNGVFGKFINEKITLTFLAFLNSWFSNISWKNWESASVISTFIYAVVFYIRLFRNPVFDNISRRKLGSVVTSLIAVAVLSVVSTIHMNRVPYMAILFSISLIYCYIDNELKTGNLESSFKITLRFSDIPVSIAFLILLIYSVILYFTDPNELIKMDAFFGGAVAFQMILSNVIWSFTDDKVMENKETETKNP